MSVVSVSVNIHPTEDQMFSDNQGPDTIVLTFRGEGYPGGSLFLSAKAALRLAQLCHYEVENARKQDTIDKALKAVDKPTSPPTSVDEEMPF